MTIETCQFSPCRLYRYTLWRHWGDLFNQSQGHVAVIGLNPSTADETEDDNTIRRCKQFAADWGYTTLCMLNLFGWRETIVRKMKAIHEPVGTDNDRHLVECCKSAKLVICAWGNDGRHLNRDLSVTTMLRAAGVTLHCLARNKDGTPGHPLYLKGTLKPIPFQ